MKDVNAASTLIESTDKDYESDLQDVVAIEGEQPDEMFRMAIDKMGGIKKFISRGDKVCIKPTIEWNVSEQHAANTNPQLVAEIIKQCFDAGAREVTVFDNSIDNWENSYHNSGIRQAAQKAGAKVVPGNLSCHYQDIALPYGSKIKSVKIHNAILDADKWINVPVLKHHSRIDNSIAKRNYMGIVWNRQRFMDNNPEQSILDISSYSKKPILNIIDAYRVITKRGPKGDNLSDVKLAKKLFVSQNIDSIDKAAVSFLSKIK